MKILTVREPLAELIAAGVKTIELRSWRTTYRGPLLLCAGSFKNNRPTGPALCVVELVDVRRYVFGDDDLATCCHGYPGAWAWVLGRVSPLPAMRIERPPA